MQTIGIIFDLQRCRVNLLNNSILVGLSVVDFFKNFISLQKFLTSYSFLSDLSEFLHSSSGAPPTTYQLILKQILFESMWSQFFLLIEYYSKY